MNGVRTCACITLVLAMVGCSGGTDAGGAPIISPTPSSSTPPHNSRLAWQPCTSVVSGDSGSAVALPGGYWYGTLTNDTEERSEPFWTIVTEDGRFRSGTYDYQSSYDVETGWAGAVVVDGNTLTATAMGYADEAANTSSVWTVSNHVGEVTFAGVIAERDTISGDWVDTTGDHGCFELFYSEPYENSSLLSQMTGIWTAYGKTSNPYVVLTVDADGRFLGQGALGCTLSGNVALSDKDYGLYEIQSAVSGCALAGSYSGFAGLDYVFYPERVLWISMDDGTRNLRITLDD